MDAPRRAVPQVDSFEDRVVPSHGGFGPGPDFGGPPAVVRGGPDGFDHAGPFVGGPPVRWTEVEFVVVRTAAVSARVEATPAVEVTRPVVAAVLATPAAAATTPLLPPSATRAEAAPGNAVAPPAQLPPVAAAPVIAAMPQTAFAPTAVAVTAADRSDFTPPSDAPPAAEAPFPATPVAPPAWEFPPLVVDLPAALPLAGALGIDVIAVEASVRRVLEQVAGIGVAPPEGWATEGWVAAAGVLAGGAGWAGLRAGRRRPAPDAVFLGWGERDDRRLG